MKAFCSTTKRILSGSLQVLKLDSQQHKCFQAFPTWTLSARHVSEICSWRVSPGIAPPRP